ncbi:MAG: hypothetical protein NT085_02630 [candidate division SR1 bacterium]|nr:hypothetical protein [candidate division SR1 bacterium]
MKKPLMERINRSEIVYEIKEQKEETNMIISSIKNDINTLKQEVYISKGIRELDKIDQIEKEISVFYEKMQKIEPEQQENTGILHETPEQVYQQAVIQQQTYQVQTNQQETALHKEQIQVMNQNISKFLMVYREKDKVIDERNKAIDEKNKSIYILQQKVNEAENKIKTIIAEQQKDINKDNIIEEKTKSIYILEQRLQEVENKFKKILLLHKSITEKEEIKDIMIKEKNIFILNLQEKLKEIEGKLQSIVVINEDNKERFLNKKLLEIDEKIQAERKKNRILIILLILFLLVGIGGFMFIYAYYIQNSALYTI